MTAFRQRHQEHLRPFRRGVVLLLAVLLGVGCRSTQMPGRPLVRQGDEIIAAGQLFHTGTRVITWMDPGGYDAYRVERRFAPFAASGWEASKPQLSADASPNRFGLRKDRLTPDQLEQVRGGGWPLSLLQAVVDQFVIHFDASGTSRRCFEVLHDHRCLSVHFMIDLDGTIYQTLDLKERAWHATTSNGRSVGVEIASPGAFPLEKDEPLKRWYQKDARGRTLIRLPEDHPIPPFANTNCVPAPARTEPIEGTIQGKQLRQYDFTEEQYRSLSRLTAALCRIFPKLTCDYPKDSQGKLIPQKLPDPQLKEYQGLLGHYHIQTDKYDPGPAFDWDRLIRETRRLQRARP